MKNKLTLFFLSFAFFAGTTFANSESSDSYLVRDCTKFAIGVYDAWVDGGATYGISYEHAGDSYADCVEAGGTRNPGGWPAVGELIRNR